MPDLTETELAAALETYHGQLSATLLEETDADCPNHSAGYGGCVHCISTAERLADHLIDSTVLARIIRDARADAEDEAWREADLMSYDAWNELNGLTRNPHDGRTREGRAWSEGARAVHRVMHEFASQRSVIA